MRYLERPSSFLLYVVLRATVKRFFGPDATIRSVTISPRNLLVYRTTEGPQSATHWRDIVRLPLTWMVVASCHYAFFAWASIHVDAAIATTILELWPVVMIALLATIMNTDTEQSTYRITRKKLIFCLLAPIGLTFVIFSQTDGPTGLLQSDASGYLFGVILAIVALTLNGISPAASLYYGEILHSQMGADRKDRHQHEKLWFTLLGFFAASLVTIPLNIIIGAIIFRGDLSISLRGIWGAILSGLLLGCGLTLLRKANHTTKDLSINAFFFTTPVLALGWLAVATISLPRIDFFVIGSTLVIALNILIQVDPDEQEGFSREEVERDDQDDRGAPSLDDDGENDKTRLEAVDQEYSEQSGKVEEDQTVLAESNEEEEQYDPRESARFGFSALILAIWASGTVIVLRDDLLQQDWILWKGPDYWGLVALSATVFALIFGFRIARLAARINSEEETTLELFRRCEQLVEADELHRGILSKLRRLDVSSGANLAESYASCRQTLIAGKDKARSENRNLDRITEMQICLDKLAHSKQQGRDFAELISLMTFATITVLLGLLARASTLALPDAGWSGFLAELFSMLFVATIAFLAFNLFDLRRDRELPLIDPRGAANLDTDLYFRSKRNLTAQRVIAVAISLFMTIAFTVLLYRKWL